MDKTLPRLMAVFRPQAWINEEAVDIPGRVRFDATESFLTLDYETIRKFKEHDYDSDDLLNGADDLPEFGAHSGPFEVDVDTDSWLKQLGFPPRAQLTDEQIERLRALFLPEDTPWPESSLPAIDTPK